MKQVSTYETSKYLKELEHKMCFKIDTVQVDNGYEFVTDIDKTGKTSLFESVALSL